MRGTETISTPKINLKRFIPACAGNRTGAEGSISKNAVHPRVCGEQIPIAHCLDIAVGSSPRVRGTGNQTPRRRQVPRFIPACAGNSVSPLASQGSPSVHPRVCGEQFAASTPFQLPGGSSPRVRGTGWSGPHGNRISRFIPACAGNSKIRAISITRAAVHPRVCGEQDRVRARIIRNHGSSPRVRGTGRCPHTLGDLFRFIPACAGNSLVEIKSVLFKPVHPRVCGEQSLCASIAAADSGSSPRVRGTEIVGKVIQRPLTVHPRVCGEQRTATLQNTDTFGSSPRVRGTVAENNHDRLVRRFIPACAGNRVQLISHFVSPSVHPRVCGEQADWEFGRGWKAGSSPRVRGTEDYRCFPRQQSRFIPACAGNSALRAAITSARAVHPRVCGEQFSWPKIDG